MLKKFLPQKLKYGTRDGKGAIARYGGEDQMRSTEILSRRSWGGATVG